MALPARMPRPRDPAFRAGSGPSPHSRSRSTSRTFQTFVPSNPAVAPGRGCVKTDGYDLSRRAGLRSSSKEPLSLTRECRNLGFSAQLAKPPEFSHSLGPIQTFRFRKEQVWSCSRADTQRLVIGLPTRGSFDCWTRGQGGLATFGNDDLGSPVLAQRGNRRGRRRIREQHVDIGERSDARRGCALKL